MELKTLEMFQPLSENQISNIYGGRCTVTCVMQSGAFSNATISYSSDTSTEISDCDTGETIQSSISYKNYHEC